MLRKNLFGVFTAIAAATLFAVMPAKASTFDFSYSGSGVSGSGEFTGNLSSAGIYQLTGITGLETDSTGTHTIGVLSSYATADNKLFYPASVATITGYEVPPTFVDVYGISFTTNAPNSWNIGNYNGMVVASMSSNDGGYSNGLLTPVNFSVAETPLPAALPLFGSVLGGGLLLLRRKRKAQQGASLGSNMVPA